MRAKTAVEEGASDSTGGQYSGATLNPSGLLTVDKARTTKDWKPSYQGPPRIWEKTAKISGRVQGDALQLKMEQGGKEVAKATLLLGDEVNGHVIEKLEVPAESRRQGFARELLQHIKKNYSEGPLSIRPRPFGDMPADIAALKKFYSSEGFEVVDGKDTMKLKTAAWNPQEVPIGQRPHGQVQPAVESGQKIRAVRQLAKGNPKRALVSLMASQILGDGKTAAIVVAAFGDELQKLRQT